MIELDVDQAVHEISSGQLAHARAMTVLAVLQKVALQGPFRAFLLTSHTTIVDRYATVRGFV